MEEGFTGDERARKYTGAKTMVIGLQQNAKIGKGTIKGKRGNVDFLNGKAG